MSILDSELATILTDALTAFDIPQSCVVTRNEVSGPPFDPIITPVAHPCKGWVDNYNQIDHVDSSVMVNDRKVFVVCSSLDIVPSTADTLTISGTTYAIVSVQRDPARACWVIQGRA